MDVQQKTWTELLRPSWQMIEWDRRDLFTLVIYVFSLGLISASVPFVSQIVVNQAAFVGTPLPIVLLGLIVLGVLLIGVAVRIFQLRVGELIGKRIFVRTGLMAAKRLLATADVTRPSPNREIANRFFDVFTFEKGFTTLISEGLSLVALSLVGMVLLAFYHPFFLAFGACVIFVALLLIVLLAKRGLVRSKAKSTEKYRAAYWLSQVAEHSSLLGQGREENLVYGTTDRFFTKYVQTYFRYLDLLLFQSGGLWLLQAIASGTFLGLGGWLVVAGRLNLGQFVAAEIIMLSVLSAMAKLDKYLDTFYETVIAGINVYDLTGDAHDLREAGEPPHLPPAPFTVRSKWLEAPLSARPGDVLILTGGRKARRSTFLRKLAAFDPPAGEVDWSHGPEAEARHLKSAFLYIAEPAVFRVSLAENLALLKPTDLLTENDAEILQLPLVTPEERSTLTTPLREYEVSLPDRARYAVLRAFVTTRPVVILDHVFNALEDEHQTEFIRVFKERFPERILIINAYNVDALANHGVSVVRLRGESK